MGARAFSCLAHRLWNALPPYIRHADSQLIQKPENTPLPGSLSVWWSYPPFCVFPVCLCTYPMCPPPPNPNPGPYPIPKTYPPKQNAYPKPGLYPLPLFICPVLSGPLICDCFRFLHCWLMHLILCRPTFNVRCHSVSWKVSVKNVYYYYCFEKIKTPKTKGCR